MNEFRVLRPLVCSFLLASLTAAAPPGGRDQTGTELKKGVRVLPRSFSVTPDGRYAAFMELKLDPATRSPTTVGWLLELPSGKMTDVSSFLGPQVSDGKPMCSAPIPSPDGRYIVFTAYRPSGMTTYLVGLEDGKVRQLAPGRFTIPVWAGPKVALSVVDAAGMLAPISLYGLDGAEPTQLKVRGLVVAADVDGKLLICACDPDKPSEPISMGALQSKAIALLNAKGQVIKQLARGRTIGVRPVFSPNGEYLAFQSGEVAPGRTAPPKGIRVDVMAVRGEEQWTIREQAEPVAIMDDGALVTLGTTPGPDGVPVKIWDKGGTSSRPITRAHAAAVAGGRLYYVTGTDPQVIKSMPLTRP